MPRRAPLVRAAAVLALVTGAAAALPSHAVVGGKAAADGAYPFMAALVDDSDFQFCGGSVISASWVLTAAHCVADDPAAPLSVVVGRNDLSDTSTGERIRVDRVVVNPAYANSAHDTALLHLSHVTTATPIRVASAADDAYEAAGTTLRVAGWGDTLPTLGLFATSQLQEADLQVVSDDDCSTANAGLDGPTAVCASALLKDSCQGDSGGPLFVPGLADRVQIGVVSYGTSCALPEFPGVYSELNNPQIRGWISQVAGV